MSRSLCANKDSTDLGWPVWLILPTTHILRNEQHIPFSLLACDVQT